MTPIYPEITLSSPYREYIGFPADDKTKKCFRLDLHRIILSSTINLPATQKEGRLSTIILRFILHVQVRIAVPFTFTLPNINILILFHPPPRITAQHFTQHG